MSIKSFSIRIDKALLDKLHVVASYEGRSANGQILVLIRKCVEEYEAKNGLPSPKKNLDRSCLWTGAVLCAAVMQSSRETAALMPQSHS